MINNYSFNVHKECNERIQIFLKKERMFPCFASFVPALAGFLLPPGLFAMLEPEVAPGMPDFLVFAASLWSLLLTSAGPLLAIDLTLQI